MKVIKGKQYQKIEDVLTKIISKFSEDKHFFGNYEMFARVCYAPRLSEYVLNVSHKSPFYNSTLLSAALRGS